MLIVDPSPLFCPLAYMPESGKVSAPDELCTPCCAILPPLIHIANALDAEFAHANSNTQTPPLVASIQGYLLRLCIASFARVLKRQTLVPPLLGQAQQFLFLVTIVDPTTLRLPLRSPSSHLDM